MPCHSLKWLGMKTRPLAMGRSSSDDRSSFPISSSVKAGVLYFLCAILWFASLEHVPKTLTNDPDREVLYESFIGLSFVFGSAAVVGFLVHREFARQQRAELVVRDSEERLRAILETAVEGIITIGERGEIELMNPAALKMFGYAPDEIIGQNIRLLMPAPDREAHDSYLANYRATGEAKIIGIGREVIGQKKDGTRFPMELSVAEARLGEGPRFVGSVRDITARKEAENRALSALKQLKDLQAALDQHSSVAITDAAGKITYANEKFCAKSKYSREELLGQDHRILNSGYHTKDFFREMWSTIQSGKVWHGEVRNRSKDSSHYWVDMTIVPFLDEAGKPTQYVAIRTDITRRKTVELELQQAVEALADKNKELEAIVYAASHDLRSPLVNIQGFSKELTRICETMKRRAAVSHEGAVRVDVGQEPFASDIPRALHFINAGVVKIDLLLSGLLRYSRVGRLVMNIQVVDMNALVDGVAQASKFQIDEAGAHFRREDLPKCFGDPSHLGQVFSNLIDNALKYRDPNRPIEIKVAGTVERGRAIYGVSDNGIGIDPEHREKVFEIFHRLNPEAAQGEGLGLTIAQRILERHNGRIWVEGRPGTGSTFFVSLPSVESQTGRPS